MEPTDRCKRSEQHCFRGCTDVTYKKFQKIFELEDVGVALYGYLPQNQDPDQTMGHMFILRTNDDVNMESDEFTMALEKNIISCPRCIKVIEKAEKLLTGRPLIKQKDIAGVCDHCWAPLERMRKLSKLTKKKKNVSIVEEVDALKVQVEQANETDLDETKEAKELKERSTTRRTRAPRKDQQSEARDEKPEAKEKSLKERETKDEKSVLNEKKAKLKETKDKNSAENEKKAKVKETKDEKSAVNEKKAKVKETKAENLSENEKKSKLKETKDEKSAVNEKKAKVKETKDETPAENDKKAKLKHTKDEKSAVNEKDAKVKETKDEKLNNQKASEEKLPREKSAADSQLKALIAQEKLKKEKEKQEAENRRKKQEEEKKMKELAEKKARELDLEREKQIKAISLPKLSVSDSEEYDTCDLAGYEAPVTTEIIKGNKLYKNMHRVAKGEDIDIIGKTTTQKLRNSGKAPVVGTKRHDEKPALASKGQEKGPVSGSPKKGAALEPSSLPEDSDITETLSAQKKNKVNGTIRYSLSDRTFIEKGWTMLPLEKVVRKMNVYRMRPSKPEFDWFERHKNKALEYDSGERLAEVDGAGRGRWYYRSGALAMDYYDAEETGAGQRFVVYSSGAPDALGRPRPRTVLATFDHSGNGIVYDHAGKTRLKYNQTEGVVLDREIGPVSRWQWHSLNDPPVLQQVMLDTQLGYKDPDIAALGPAETPRPEDEAMLSIELDNFVKEKSKKSSQNFKPYQIKMKALKINENFSLRVLDQASVYLSFRDGSTNLKINIGMLLDHKEIVDTDTADISEVSNKMDKLPAHTASIAQLQQSVARARARAAAERAARARLAGCPEDRLSVIDSVDALRKAISGPPRTPFFTCCASATHNTPKLFKSCSCDLYCKPLS